MAPDHSIAGDAGLASIMARLEAAARPGVRAGMARLGIAAEVAVGVAVPDLRRIARKLGPDQDAALRLW